MQDFGTKADNSPPPGGQLSAAEFNNLATENENAVLRSGQTLSGASDTQLAQSLFLHAVKSESFQDSGAANAYVATPISGASGVFLPSAYTAMSGAVIAFKASNANSGASTLNIGQTTGTLLGAKPIRTQGDAAIIAGSILAGQYVELVYNSAFDSGNGAWELRPWALNGGRLLRTTIYINTGGVLQSSVDGSAFANASSTFTPISGASFADIEAVGGGGGGGNAASTGAGQVSAGSGGGGGGYARKRVAIATISGVTIAVGAGGASGVTGSTTSIGAVITASGGTGGSVGAAASVSNSPFGVTSGGIGTSGDINARGQQGGYALYSATPQQGGGGGSIFGFGPIATGGVPTTGTAGAAGESYGSGGSGAANGASVAGNSLGGAGKGGLAIVKEYSQ